MDTCVQELRGQETDSGSPLYNGRVRPVLLATHQACVHLFSIVKDFRACPKHKRNEEIEYKVNDAYLLDYCQSTPSLLILTPSRMMIFEQSDKLR